MYSYRTATSLERLLVLLAELFYFVFTLRNAALYLKKIDLIK